MTITAETQSTLLIISYVIIFLLFLQNIFLLKKFKKIFKSKNNKSLDDVLISQIEDSKKTSKKIEDILKEISKIKEDSKDMINKVDIKRYNPFNDQGSDQSFTISILNGRNNGLVLTALHSREGVRVYAKPIKNKNSNYRLSDEEIEILK